MGSAFSIQILINHQEIDIKTSNSILQENFKIVIIRRRIDHNIFAKLITKD